MLASLVAVCFAPLPVNDLHILHVAPAKRCDDDGNVIDGNAGDGAHHRYMRCCVAEHYADRDPSGVIQQWHMECQEAMLAAGVKRESGREEVGGRSTLRYSSTLQYRFLLPARFYTLEVR